ncbi:hypothetical protein E2C01_049094 [Portunus trituberculatus]|uniref:Uncharacterized protein n=1 Tax=Portunus trituberculatus TaxID=210409 RepID=A0A5B7G8A5_PORTR|nr:hypothetical protein [Portunus trituberculatus]
MVRPAAPLRRPAEHSTQGPTTPAGAPPDQTSRINIRSRPGHFRLDWKIAAKASEGSFSLPLTATQHAPSRTAQPALLLALRLLVLKETSGVCGGAEQLLVHFLLEHRVSPAALCLIFDAAEYVSRKVSSSEIGGIWRL